MDTSLTGDPRAASWGVYCSGGIASRQFDLRPSSADVRTLQESYPSIGQECMGDPPGPTQTHPIPNTAGKVITTEWGRNIAVTPIYRCLLLTLSSGWQFLGLRVGPRGGRPAHAEKVVLMERHVALSGDGVSIGQFGRTVHRTYPGGIARHILRSAQNHFESNLPPRHTRGRAGWNPMAADTREISPNLHRQVFGQDSLSAVLSGVAPGARTRYLSAWTHWKQFMADRHRWPWI